MITGYAFKKMNVYCVLFIYSMMICGLANSIPDEVIIINYYRYVIYINILISYKCILINLVIRLFFLYLIHF